MSYPGYSSIFNRIRREAGLEALKLARTMEKTTYKLEAHHRHLHFTHKAIENQWIPKSLRFKPPGIHPVFKRIMERASKHCMRARISICHDRIRFLKETLDESKQQLSRNYGRFAYGSFRLRSVRLRLESIRLRLVCQFAYVLKHVLQH